jgi:hypothetical protein
VGVACVRFGGSGGDWEGRRGRQGHWTAVVFLFLFFLVWFRGGGLRPYHHHRCGERVGLLRLVCAHSRWVCRYITASCKSISTRSPHGDRQ